MKSCISLFIFVYSKAIYFICINGKNERLLRDYFSVELFAVST